MVILNEDTFEERYSLKLTRLNVFVLVTTSAILLIAATTFIIAFTPLREYIPGYSSPKLKEQAAQLAYKTDSLQNVLKLNNQFLGSIKGVLSGDLQTSDLNRDSIAKFSQENMEVEVIPPSTDKSPLALMSPFTVRVFGACVVPMPTFPLEDRNNGTLVTSLSS